MDKDFLRCGGKCVNPRACYNSGCVTLAPNGQEQCYAPGPCACVGMCALNKLPPCCQASCSCDHAGEV
jgi:hypothetical protein